MIEKELIRYLSGAFPQIPVYAERPVKEIPETYIVIEKTGTRRLNHIKTSTIAVQSYGPSMQAAAELNERVVDAMESMASLDEVSAVRLNTDYNFTDTASKVYRYQAVFDITHY